MASPSCVVVDYGIGNVFSVTRAVERAGATPELTGDPERILAADRLILPGVGAFGRAAERLRALALDEVIHAYAATGKPFLGICVGMQLLMETGHEFGTHKGLGIVPGAVTRIEGAEEDGSAVRVPHIGWTPVEEAREGAWEGTPFEALRGGRDGAGAGDGAFYFVHSFAARPEDPAHAVARHRVGTQWVTSAVRRDNVLGIQFHPERSAEMGQAFLSAFLS